MSRFVFAAILLLLGASTAMATTVLRMDLDALTRTSDVILVGTVSQVQPSLVGGKVHTTTTITPTAIWKGRASPNRVVLRHLGGKTKTLVTRVAGMPDFEVGEQTLLFLVKPDKHKFFIVNGLEQGKFSVGPDGKILPRETQLRLVEPLNGEWVSATPGDLHHAVQNLDSLKLKVEALLKEASK